MVGLAFTSTIAAAAVLALVFSGTGPAVVENRSTQLTAASPAGTTPTTTGNRTEPKDDPLPKDPGPTPVPKDAVVLFDGKDLLRLAGARWHSAGVDGREWLR